MTHGICAGAAVVLVVLSFHPASAIAQPIVARSYDELRPLLTEGRKIVVVTENGTKTTGQVERVSPDEFAIRVGGRRNGDPDAHLRTYARGPLVARERNDKTLNGALIGLAVGAVAGGLVMSACECEFGKGEAFGYGAVIFGFIGMGVGGGVDALVRHKELIVEYRALPVASRPLGISPRFTRRSAGVMASVRF